MKARLEKYLAGKFRPSTVKTYIRMSMQFKHWCMDNHIDPEKANLDELYTYKSHLAEKGFAPSTVRQNIKALAYLFRAIERKDNPALLVRHAKIERALPRILLSKDELEELYLSIEARGLTGWRDKCLFGMLIFPRFETRRNASLEN